MKFDLDQIKSIENDIKRWFALGFIGYCKIFGKDSQKTIAISAKVSKGTISSLCNGSTIGFPGPKTRQKIAEVFGKDEFDLINKGREVESGQDEILLKKELKPHQAPTDNDQASLPFPHYLEVMKLPIQYRAMAIKRVAAEAHGFKNWLESTGDRMLHGDAPSPLEQRYLDGEITEEDIYKEYKEFFKGLEERTLEEFKRRGLL